MSTPWTLFEFQLEFDYQLIASGIYTQPSCNKRAKINILIFELVITIVIIQTAGYCEKLILDMLQKKFSSVYGTLKIFN